VNANLDYFSNIIPCGIQDKAVTSLNKELGQDVNMPEIKEKLKKHFSSLFECELIF
jgi:lipoyl(octanoyl) transferase